MPFNEENIKKCALVLVYVQVWGWPSRRCQHQHPRAQSAKGDHACDWDTDLLQLIEVLHLSLSLFSFPCLFPSLPFSLSFMEAHRQADSECLVELTSGQVAKAEGALEHIISEVVFLWLSHFSLLSLSLSLCSFIPACLSTTLYI